MYAGTLLSLANVLRQFAIRKSNCELVTFQWDRANCLVANFWRKKKQLTRLTVCSLCILTTCNFRYFPFCFWGLDLGSDCSSSWPSHIWYSLTCDLAYTGLPFSFLKLVPEVPTVKHTYILCCMFPSMRMKNWNQIQNAAEKNMWVCMSATLYMKFDNKYISLTPLYNRRSDEPCHRTKSAFCFYAKAKAQFSRKQQLCSWWAPMFSQHR